jgi:hypothetical protein
MLFTPTLPTEVLALIAAVDAEARLLPDQVAARYGPLAADALFTSPHLLLEACTSNASGVADRLLALGAGPAAMADNPFARLDGPALMQMVGALANGRL